ncbi:tyrosine-type recombinase/integrase [Hoeflea sp.]|uniref:tyrosine-type recombinase/integrase n=1 Tax=Hoeflea sp. TaxID=1940281 RepID=UPI003B012578
MTRRLEARGNRLYLNAEERAAFLAAARKRPARDRTLCETLHYTGCRPAELIEIPLAWIDLSAGTVTIRNLKKRPDSSGRRRSFTGPFRSRPSIWTRSTPPLASARHRGRRNRPPCRYGR